ncbi:MAG: hypothetical protein IJG97_06730 [Bacilli bacterium]|nr:hypothetical protein [Bacilli bacterium]
MKKLIELKSLNIVFYENKFYTISGSNNSGKTTLIRILNASDNLFKAVIPFELRINRDNLLEELNYQKIDKELVDYILKGLKIKGISKRPINSLSKKEIILIQIALALAKRPKALLLDSIDNYLSEDEINKLFKFLKDYQNKYTLAVINTTINLKESLLTDYLYVLHKGEVILEGEPLNVLQNDNILNRIGLEVPFMIDLSVKLRDYELISDIELDQDRMVDILWK